MGSYHLNTPNTASDTPINVTTCPSLPPMHKPPRHRLSGPAGLAGRAEWTVFRRLDIEIDQTDCEKIEQMKAMLGVRSTVDVIRHALRVLFFLASQVSQGYEVVLVHENKRKQFSTSR